MISNDEIEQAFREGLEAGRPKWIPVDDRLPDYGERVLVINEAYTEDQRYTMYNVGCTIRSPSLNFTFWGRKITHWRPLPEPPKEE